MGNLRRVAPGSFMDSRQNSCDASGFSSLPGSLSNSHQASKGAMYPRRDSLAVPVSQPEEREAEASYGGYTVGDRVIRKGKTCILVDIDFTTSPPDAIIKAANGRQIITEFDQLEKPDSPRKTVKGYQGFLVGDEVVRKGQICTLIDIDFALDPPGALVLTQKGTEVSTEFTFLSKPDSE